MGEFCLANWRKLPCAPASVDTVRFTRRRGRIVSCVRSSGGYRLFPRNTERIQFIKQAQDFGFRSMKSGRFNRYQWRISECCRVRICCTANWRSLTMNEKNAPLSSPLQKIWKRASAKLANTDQAHLTRRSEHRTLLKWKLWWEA